MEDQIVTSAYSSRSILLVGIGLAIVSLAFSAAILWYQAAESSDHIVGSVVVVSPESIVIMSARGRNTTLIITAETKIGDISPLEELKKGTQLIAAGTFIDKETFVADGIRKFDKKR